MIRAVGALAGAGLLLVAAAPQAAHDPCRWQETTGGSTVVHIGPDRDCVRWGPQQRFTGIWVAAFEGSRYIDGATTLAEARRPSTPDEWVWFHHDERSKDAAALSGLHGRVVLVEFEGRRTLETRKPLEGYGHFGMFPNEVIVDRLIRARDLGSVSSAR